uniref:Uncharacterized protein n=1 Tax=Ditylenchus dipsaci TaxID=166011 RepID=A0A915DZW8_9BILA
MTASSSLIYSNHVASQPSTTSFYPSLAESECSDDESCSRLPKVSALTDEEDDNGSPPSLHLNNLLLLTSRASQQKRRPTSIPSNRFPVIEEDLHSLSRQITTVEECHWRELPANKPQPKTIHISPKKNSTPKIIAPKNLDGACDCTSLAWATLRNRPSTASSSRKLRTKKRLSLGADDDSYRPRTSTNLLLPASPGESTSTDSGIALSVSSSGSSRSDSTSSSGLMTRLGEEGLPPPPSSGATKEGGGE